MTRKIILFAIAPVLAVGLSACGSSETGSEPSPTTPAASPGTTSSSSGSAEPSSPSPSEEAEVVITIKDFDYEVPASVAPGATITIENRDSQAHTVTSEDGGFDVKVDPKGTATMTAPDTAGSYDVVCRFHANMSGTLVVK